MLNLDIGPVQLKQLIEIYNKVGDELFKNNVRYGLEDSFGVDAAIKNTLEKDPEMFWFCNNGITIIVENSDFILDKSSKITLYTKIKHGDKLGFSVINGAQTITASAKYYYELKNSKQTDEIKEKLKNVEKAKVLLRLINIKEGNAIGKNKQGVIDEVSVALNRQKPIKSEDIAYISTQVMNMYEYIESHKDTCEFILEKRGEKSGDNRGLNLIDLARAMKAIKGKPNEARAASSKKLLEQDVALKQLKDKEIFPDIKMGTDETRQNKSFEEVYKWVFFANSVATMYSKEYKNIEMMLDDEIERVVLNNARWYFVAYLVQYLSENEKSTDTQEGRKKFLNDIKELKENEEKKIISPFYKLVISFVKYAAEVINQEKIENVNSNTFKTNHLYEKLNEKKKDIFSSIVSESKQETSNRVKIKRVEIYEDGKCIKSLAVKNTAEAYKESISYLGTANLNTLTSKLDILTWVTKQKEHERSEVISLASENYYINTNAGAKEMRNRVNKTLGALNLSKDTILWYEEGKEEPYEI